MVEVRLLGERVEEGERKRGCRKRKEENGVQAHKRVEIILDHKGWNSIENLGYSKSRVEWVAKMQEVGRKRKEENGVQAPNRAEIILDHKGWNSRKSRIF